MTVNNSTSSSRQKEIVQQYVQALDTHVAELRQGKATRAKEIRDFAAGLFIHPVHLSNTIKEVTGQSACDLYEQRLLAAAKEMLLDTSMPVADIARQLTYDPSNFTKFFKAYTGTTPKKFRDALV